jgi:CheY-like chemotaxis protein
MINSINKNLEVDFCNNGQEALEKIEENVKSKKQGSYNIIFTDIHMPIMDGLTLIKNIKLR